MRGSAARAARWLCTACLAMLPAVRVVAQSTAFWYEGAPPDELSTAYDQLVVEPEHVPDPQTVARHGAAPVAYFSVGEVAKSSEEAKRIDPSWVLTTNKGWASVALDLRAEGVRSHLLTRYERLWSAGYRRFFLDTLDSYQLAAMAERERARLRAASIELVRTMVKRHPDVKLLLNRGFDLLPELAPIVHGVVAESLFDRWDAVARRYTRVSAADRTWLLARLREVEQRYRLPVTVIDYRPPSDREAARETARRIAALGFQPYVCDAALSTMGVSTFEILPRRVLILSDDATPDAQSEALRLLSPVLEYLGYVPVWQSAAEPLPEFTLAGRYRGVITWFHDPRPRPAYAAWMLAQLKAGVRFAIFGAIGVEPDGDTAKALGLSALSPAQFDPKGPLRVETRDAIIGFEADVPARAFDTQPLALRGPGITPHLQLLDARGRPSTAIATTRFGGVALSHVLAMRGLAGERSWVLDPFAFLQRALSLQDMPVPDLTTHNGRRVALFVIRASGLGARARLRGRPYTYDVLHRQILARYRWPHTIDVSQRADGAGRIARVDRAAARRLLGLPHVMPGRLPMGTTDVRPRRPTLTHVQAMVDGADDAHDVPAPIAADTTYLGAGDVEAYPYRQVLETLAFTDKPRRLKPIALHYHAFSAASPGGLGTLRKLYDALEREQPFAVSVDEYRQSVQAFREQVLVRELDGAYCVRGGEVLRTLRWPEGLGEPDLTASSALSVVRTLPQGRYASFAEAGRRCLSFSPAGLVVPHLRQTNARVRQWQRKPSADPDVELRFRLSGAGPLQLELAGVHRDAAYRLDYRGGSVRGRSDRSGALVFNLATDDTGNATLRRAEPGVRR